MILVIEMEILAKFNEEQMKELLCLTAKDQIFLITKEDGVLPVSMLPKLTKINAKLEVKTLPKGDSGFEKGFLYGSLSRAAGKDRVVILSEETAPASLTENCAWNEGFGIKPRKKTATKAPKASENAPLAKESPESAPSPVRKTRKAAESKAESGEKEVLATGLFDVPSVKGCLDLIGDKKEVFRKCLSDASDAEIGYKMLLGLNFGKDGDIIWEKTKGQFKKLRKFS